MAIIRTSSIVAGISGSVGGQTFVNSRNGVVARIRPHRRPSPSGVLLTQQALFANLTRAWRTTTAEDRDAWRALALDNPKTNRVGQTSQPSGFQFFLEVNLNRVRSGSSITLSPPELILQNVDIPIEVTFQAPATYDILFTLANKGIGTKVQISGSRSGSTIVPKFSRGWRIVHEQTLPFTSFFTADVFNAWVAAFGAMEPGEAFALRIIFYSPFFDILPRAPIEFTGNVLPA